MSLRANLDNIIPLDREELNSVLPRERERRGIWHIAVDALESALKIQATMAQRNGEVPESDQRITCQLIYGASGKVLGDGAGAMAECG